MCSSYSNKTALSIGEILFGNFHRFSALALFKTTKFCEQITLSAYFLWRHLHMQLNATHICGWHLQILLVLYFAGRCVFAQKTAVIMGINHADCLQICVYHRRADKLHAPFF